MAATWETFVSCAAPIILSKGFRGTGLNEIIAAAGLTKGAFYYHFKDKDDFGVRYIRHAGAQILKLMEDHLTAPDTPASRRLMGFFRDRARRYEENGFVGGCPLGNLAQELPDSLPQLRDELGKAFGMLCQAIARGLDEGRETGVLRPPEDTRTLSLGLMSAWQGALTQSKLYKSGDAVNAFLTLYFGAGGWFEDEPYM